MKLLLSTEDSVMRKAIKAGEGLRILNQDKWETLITFIISQNNNITRIKKCVESLCANFGERIGKLHGEPIFAFPSIETLARVKEEELAVCRLGYRARYIAEAARQVAFDGGALLMTGDKLETAKIEKYLTSLSGVGPKVAHCVMLYSMKKSEAFPIDVWVRRVMNRLYGMGEDNLSAMRDYAERNFGELGGVAQQYLFNYIRDIAITNPRLYKRLNFEEPPAKP
jgi:N-glycosylase/DNA lyase